MKNWKLLLTLMAIVVAGSTMSPTKAEACFVCSVDQWCVPGSEGSSCTTYLDEGGRRWCQFTLDCGPGLVMGPLQVSPAGTYIPGSAENVSETVEGLVACNGFIVAYSAASEEVVGVHSAIRI